jgi:protein-disulfide isomerase
MRESLPVFDLPLLSSRRAPRAGLSAPAALAALVALTAAVCLLLPGAATAEEDAAAASGPAATFAPHTWGDPEAPVKLLEFSSYTCGHCAAFHRDTLPTLMEEYIEPGKVHLTLVDFPLDNIAASVSMITHCAPEGMQTKLVDIFYTDQDAWLTRNPLEPITGIARLAGLSAEGVDACLDDAALREAIIERRAAAAERWSITGTPTFVINGEKHRGDYRLDTMQEALDAALESAAE